MKSPLNKLYAVIGVILLLSAMSVTRKAAQSAQAGVSSVASTSATATPEFQIRHRENFVFVQPAPNQYQRMLNDALHSLGFMQAFREGNEVELDLLDGNKVPFILTNYKFTTFGTDTSLIGDWTNFKPVKLYALVTWPATSSAPPLMWVCQASDGDVSVSQEECVGFNDPAATVVVQAASFTSLTGEAQTAAILRLDILEDSPALSMYILNTNIETTLWGWSLQIQRKTTP